MVNSKRRLEDDSDNEEELKQEIIASSSQLNAGSHSKVRLNYSLIMLIVTRRELGRVLTDLSISIDYSERN